MSLDAVFALLAAAVFGLDPPVPPGRDPGGRAVAIIGRGLDYTLPEIAQRLARDGEGEIVSHDVVDDDRRPYAARDKPSDLEAAELVLGEGQATKLIPLRADLGSWESVGKAIGLAGVMPAQIIVVLAPLTGDRIPEILASASKRFADKLFIAAAGDDGADIDARGPALKPLPNVLVVASTDPRSNRGALSVDIAAPTDAAKRPSDAAAARIGALAARLLAIEPELTAAALKSRILGLAEPFGDPKQKPANSGFIPDPRRHFWLE